MTPAVGVVLQSPDARVRALAADALAAIAPPTDQTVDWLVALESDPVDTVALAAARALARLLESLPGRVVATATRLSNAHRHILLRTLRNVGEPQRAELERALLTAPAGLRGPLLAELRLNRTLLPMLSRPTVDQLTAWAKAGTTRVAALKVLLARPGGATVAKAYLGDADAGVRRACVRALFGGE